MERGNAAPLSGGKILLLGGLLYLVFLVAAIPAGVIARQVEKLTAKSVLLSNEQGTLWHGTADISIAAANRAAPRRLGSVSWRFRPADLLVGKLGFMLEFADRDALAEGVLRLGVGGVQCKDVKAEIPADWLARQHGALAAWQPGGKLVLETADFSFASGEIVGRAALRWLNASSALAAQPLGSYRANLEGKAQGVAIALATEQGALDLSGTGNWSRQEGLAFDGIARTRAGAAGLDPLLRVLGPAQSDGAHLIRIRGRPAN